MLPPLPRCGPSGWAHPDWYRRVYPRRRLHGFHPLRYLAGYFDLVEIDVSFHRPIRPEVAGLWLRQVSDNPDFVFTAVLGRQFTHERVLEPAQVAAFKEGLWPLLRAGRLGCVVMQFPWSFRFTGENRDFFLKLRRTFHEFPLVAEMRHASWMLDEAIGTFIDYRVGFVNLDQPPRARAMPPTAFLTSGIAYFRLHTRRDPNWQHEFGARAEVSAPSYLYTQFELEQWKMRIQRVAKLADSTFVVATNETDAASAVNALQLGSMLGDPRRRAPAELFRHYPHELTGFATDIPVQNDLFPADSQRAVA